MRRRTALVAALVLLALGLTAQTSAAPPEQVELDDFAPLFADVGDGLAGVAGHDRFDRLRRVFRCRAEVNRRLDDSRADLVHREGQSNSPCRANQRRA